jgi:ankyrin repeat protein
MNSPNLEIETLLGAAFDGNAAVVRSAISHGAPVNGRDRFGASALHWSSRTDHPDCHAVIGILLRRGADALARDLEGRTPIEWALAAGNMTAVAILRRGETSIELPKAA